MEADALQDTMGSLIATLQVTLRPICRLGGTGFARLGEIIHLARPRIPRT